MLRQSLLLTLLPVLAAHPATPDGEALYKQRCATCHDGKPQPRMPSRQELSGRTPESIYQAMFGGVMDLQSTGLSSAEQRAIGRIVSAQELGNGGDALGRQSAPAPPAAT